MDHGTLEALRNLEICAEANASAGFTPAALHELLQQVACSAFHIEICGRQFEESFASKPEKPGKLVISRCRFVAFNWGGEEQ